MIASELPRIYELGESAWRVAVFAVGILFYVAIVFTLLHRSLRRLFFFDVLEKPLAPDAGRVPLKKLREDERFVLGALVGGGMPTPHPELETTMARLVRRGLLDPDTLALRLGDGDRKVCVATCSPVYEQLVAEADPKGTWNTIKTPLATGLLVLCATLGVSEPDTSGILAPTLVAALPALLRAVSAVAVLRRP